MRSVRNVAPFAGAWIEIINRLFNSSKGASLPSRERGLKFTQGIGKVGGGLVAPFAGAWIEISAPLPLPDQRRVAPFAGAWIEIYCPI